MNAPVRPQKLLSASGHLLEGDRLVRVTYMDESGLGKRESILVEAAIIVHGDDQVVPVEEHLEGLVEKHIPSDKREGFFFHATDIYGGGDKDCIFHDKAEWPDERRWAILDDLVAVPAKFKLPVCAGIIQKARFADALSEKTHTALEISVAQHALAIIQCEIAVEMWLRKNTEKEITHVIAENNNEVRHAAREAHVLLRNKDEMAKEGFVDHACFPFKRIRDGLQFTTKAESRLLQVADACSWAVRRAANNAPIAFRFYQPVRDQIVLLDRDQVAALKEQSS
jgi:Protein of unknown function (DUF3800)